MNTVITERNLLTLADRWSHASAAERANAQSYLIELCEALGVERPRPAGTGYEFERPVRVVSRDGTESTNFIDLYKAGHFILEAKHQESGKPDSQLLHRAYGQARFYASSIEGARPPYLLVLDVGRTMLVWDRWGGVYGGFQARRHIDLTTLADKPSDIALLRDIFENPAAQDPRARAAAVTEETAGQLAKLAGRLEQRGHDAEAVARFLMRAVFTMFAEDIELLPEKPFTRAIEAVGFKDPEDFAVALQELWRAMDGGGRFGFHKLLRFNGHFFRDQEVLPLTREDLAILYNAAKADWSDVEPAIMGTLLTRALDPEERHRLGAEYTPRAYVERLVRPTVEDPIRERWTAVQAEVLQLRDPAHKTEPKKRKDEKIALERLREFHAWLRGLRFLDPACGSGNFLYVTLAIVKEIELEALRAIEEITGNPELAVEEVGPWQFYGIEIKSWARELAELTIWIGYHQWWRRTHGHTQPPEPVLRDTGTLEHRDAVLAWDDVVEDPARARPDPTLKITHPVTGKLVPDPEARLAYHQYQGARQAEWPEADFIVGNPPYMGRGRQREAFGDGYVDSLRAVYPKMSENADFVMYWWQRASEAVASRATIRAGLITTNTITQRHNREVIEAAAANDAFVTWAVADHPWVDESGSAAVRVAMTVISRDPASATLITVDDMAQVTDEIQVPRLNADLTSHADVATATAIPLQANKALSSQGFTLVGEGFRLAPEEGESLLNADLRHEGIVRPIMNGRDITSRPRGIYTIDFGLMSEQEAKEFPVLYNIVRDRIKPGREANNDRSTRERWWRFGRNREDLRQAISGLTRYIVTVETSKHRFFQFLPAEIATEHSVVCIALEDPFYLGVLSSQIHSIWALAAGGTLEDRPRYQKALCFDPFPFPTPSPALREEIAAVAEKLDQHRKDALARDEKVTLTGIYNLIEKLRAGTALTPAERRVHEIAACGVLLDYHNELDRLVAEAYGWPWPLVRDEILARLVRLHAERTEEEESGLIRWLRPEYQIPRYGREEALEPSLHLVEGAKIPTEEAKPPWPTSVIEQIGAVQALLAQQASTVEEIVQHFRNIQRDLLVRHLGTLELMGEVRLDSNGAYHMIRETV